MFYLNAALATTPEQHFYFITGFIGNFENYSFFAM